MAEFFQEQAAVGSLGLALPIALLVGLVSFFTPCTLPLLPGYLSYATGLSGADIVDGRGHRGRMLLGSVLFVSGFAAVFVALGAAFGSVGTWLRTWQDTITVVLGALLVVLGLVFAGAVPWLQREWRIHTLPGVGLGSAPLVGALFAIGWQPCVGPTYGVIVGLTFDDATAARGALLSFVYALGLGLPFILAAVFYRRLIGAFGWVRRHQAWVMRLGGLMLIAVGLLMVTGWWGHLTQWVQIQFVDDFGVYV
ncbi:cytochrome c biogenesis protein CcdA [Nocardioides panacisoli]|uniref:cytochrome c biogenesis CcdA family protein n=1 Tax=Nocardioides panacisoli TaxID=627624 RepID=UPI001C62DB07|nr:cytochrome c biogenesis protein CcdA [Nocardioides panacisoli]QYJ03782.1 cytochrome c biogenesis protein CcdA [Nocardioides panacisoli]